MAAWHVVLDRDLEPRWLPRDPGKLAVVADGEEGARCIGVAAAVKAPDGSLVVSLDDGTFTDHCNGHPRSDGDRFGAKPHSHRGDISNGGTPYARPLVAKTPKGWSLVALELTGMDMGEGNEVQLQPGVTPAVTIPPAPTVDLTPIPGLWR